MKRILICLFLISCFIFTAYAEEAPEGSVLEVVKTQYPGCTIAHADQCGNTAAVTLEHEGKKILCILEKQGGQWALTVNSSTILQPDAGMPSALYLDDDQTLFWKYTGFNVSTGYDDTTFQFHASRAQDGNWYFNDEIMMEVNAYNETDNGLYETMMVWSEEMDGCLVVTERLTDENENLIYQKDPLYFPAAWLKDKMDLRYFDINKLPYLMELEYPGQWPDHNYRRAAAEQLMPEYTYQGGSMSGKTLQLLMDKPDGTRVLVVYDLTDGTKLIESTPLPSDTYYGVENFTTSLGINGLCVTIDKYSTYGVTYLNGYMAKADALRFGPRVVGSDSYHNNLINYGKHPWKDIQSIDWNTLPTSQEEAAKAMDTSRYALVYNPDPKDRLHLREKPSRESKSLGKYYSGSPVLVHRVEGDWVEVTAIGDGWGQSGWMMKKYLVFSDSLVVDLDVMPDWQFRKGAMLYAAPTREAYCRQVMNTYDWQVVGIIGEKWLHVWNPWTGEAGFARVEDEMPGNG